MFGNVPNHPCLSIKYMSLIGWGKSSESLISHLLHVAAFKAVYGVDLVLWGKHYFKG
jgi:hypothetical protein